MTVVLNNNNFQEIIRQIHSLFITAPQIEDKLIDIFVKKALL